MHLFVCSCIRTVCQNSFRQLQPQTLNGHVKHNPAAWPMHSGLLRHVQLVPFICLLENISDTNHWSLNFFQTMKSHFDLLPSINTLYTLKKNWRQARNMSGDVVGLHHSFSFARVFESCLYSHYGVESLWQRKTLKFFLKPLCPDEHKTYKSPFLNWHAPDVVFDKTCTESSNATKRYRMERDTDSKQW